MNLGSGRCCRNCSAILGTAEAEAEAVVAEAAAEEAEPSRPPTPVAEACMKEDSGRFTVLGAGWLLLLPCFCAASSFCLATSSSERAVRSYKQQHNQQSIRRSS